MKHSLLIVNNAILLFCMFNFVQKCLFFGGGSNNRSQRTYRLLVFTLKMDGQVKRTALRNMLHINKLRLQIKKQVF